MIQGWVLIIVDMQDTLIARVENKQKIIRNIIKLIEASKILNIPILVTEQYPEGLGTTTIVIKNRIPNFKPIQKTQFSCFKAKKFLEKIEELKASKLILTGVETHICILQTALDAPKEFEVYVVADAVSSSRHLDHEIALRRLINNGITITTTESLIFQLLERADTPQFKKILPIIKEEQIE